MAVFPVQAISQDNVKVRFKEPYVSSALNRRFTGFPLGIYRGWVPSATGPLELTLTPDVTFGDNVGMTEAPNAYGVHVRTTDVVVLDFTSHVVWPVFVVLEGLYTPPTGGSTSAQIKTVAAPTYPSQLKICKVDKPGASIVVTSVVPADRQEPFAFAGVTAGFMPGGSIEQLQAAVVTTNEVVAARSGFLQTFPLLDARLDAELAAGGPDGMASRLAKDASPVLGMRVNNTNFSWWSGLGSSVNVSQDFKTIDAGGSALLKGAVTDPPDNLVFLRDTDSDEMFDSLGRLVYGRLTYASVVLTDDATPGLTFTNGFAAVVGTGTLFTTELSPGDLIEGPDGDFHVVETITDNLNLTLKDVYPSPTLTITGAERRRFTLTFYVLVAGVDTVHTFVAAQNLDYYSHQVFDAADRPFQSDVVRNFRRGLSAGDMPVGSATLAGKSRLIVDGSTDATDGALGTLDNRAGGTRVDTNTTNSGALSSPTAWRKGVKIIAGSNITATVVQQTDRIEITLAATSSGTATPTGPAGGDLSGTYPNPAVATVGGLTAAAIVSAINVSLPARDGIETNSAIYGLAATDMAIPTGKRPRIAFFAFQENSGCSNFGACIGTLSAQSGFALANAAGTDGGFGLIGSSAFRVTNWGPAVPGGQFNTTSVIAKKDAGGNALTAQGGFGAVLMDNLP